MWEGLPFLHPLPVDVMAGESLLRVMVAEWPSNQFFNLAFEEAFYLEASTPTLRFWRNDRVVVIGRFQCAALEVNAVEARRLGVKLVRRFTGGGAVYHDMGNINYAVVLPREAARSVEDGFRLVGEAVVEALESLGVRGAYYRPLNDVEIGGRKVSGMAATLSASKVFVHGAMLVSSDIPTLWRVLKVTKEKLSDKKFVGSRVKRVVTLEEALGRSVSVEELYKALADTLSRKLGLEPLWDKPGRKEVRRAIELYRSKYSRLSWNLRFLGEVEELLPREEVEALKEIAKPSPSQDKLVEELEAREH